MTNVAIRKAASQSSVGEDTAAGKAVDGFPWDRPPFCAVTDPISDGLRPRWWRVNLAGIYKVFHVVITGLVTNRKSLKL